MSLEVELKQLHFISGENILNKVYTDYLSFCGLKHIFLPSLSTAVHSLASVWMVLLSFAIYCR